ncbi:23S rRNA (adenine(2030)-N(6))-methyltransferase RlmJ [Caenimonas koreensis]|uniref:23S rRNA (adenine(2030)-N(6))-methyltransferase RlmJ n=1 Tax=Caenimonas koreensis TaxID=367474 RepID=UPI003783023D
MYSYRHGFHAGNHADVLKHAMLIAILKHLTQKDAALTVVDTHAGAGLYRLDGDYAGTSGEAEDGVVKLFTALAPPGSAKPAIEDVAPLIQDYMELIAEFNPQGTLKIYPGSPFVVQKLLRTEARDKLKLFEMHPTDSKALAANIAQLNAGRQIAGARQDGFEGLKAFLPPPSRRGLVLIDPSYEIKSDYAKVATCIQDSLRRFPTGTYAVWYPVIPRPEAHDLPRRLKTLSNQAGKPWLHATLAIGQDEARNVPGEEARGQGLTASGMFIVNPPHVLKAALTQALPQLVKVLGRGRGQGHTLESGG